MLPTWKDLFVLLENVHLPGMYFVDLNKYFLYFQGVHLLDFKREKRVSNLNPW